jgi:streptomycin 6-kinase
VNSALRARLGERVRAWGLTIEQTLQTSTSIVGFGSRAAQPIVLKLIRVPGDEWDSGAVVAAFDGQAMVRVFEQAPGAILLERLVPGTALFDWPDLDDAQATDIIARVMQALKPANVPIDAPTVSGWGRAFDDYRATGNNAIDPSLLDTAQQCFNQLASSQSNITLLHGDLHHYNILFDQRRGWLAIDPKGVIGERAYEAGAALRNPVGRPAVFGDAANIEARIDRYADALGADPGRLLQWGFAQAVLSALWMIEDGLPIARAQPVLRFAQTLREMIDA